MGRTINQIVQGKYDRSDSQRRLWAGEGFDLKYELVMDGGDYSRVYTEDQDMDITDILNEVVRNGFKAIYGVGEPRLELEGAAKEAAKQIHAEVTLKLSEKDDFYLVTVIDNGDGIPEEDQLHIFDDSFSTRGTGGIGLGIVSRKVLRLRGKIYFESTVGEGTTFYVELPKEL